MGEVLGHFLWSTKTRVVGGLVFLQMQWGRTETFEDEVVWVERAVTKKEEEPGEFW